MPQKTILLMVFIIFITSCASYKYNATQKKIQTFVADPFFHNQFVGFMVYDPESRDTLYQINAQKYFTPASNTKIFTLYTALKVLPGKIPALKYEYGNDTLFIKGTADPTQLHPYFSDSTVVHFLKKHENILYTPSTTTVDRFGPGWAWEDYDSYYAPERSALPLYGNVVQVGFANRMEVLPSYFLPQLHYATKVGNRDFDRNIFYVDTLRKDTVQIPFRVSDSLTVTLLQQASQKTIHLGVHKFNKETETLYGLLADSVYSRMMHESDNFLAEHILLNAAGNLSDTLDIAIVQRYILEHHLADLKQQPRWVDGSGLSRYNLFSPESMVHVLQKMYSEFPREQILPLFPAAGVSGTLKTWDSVPGEPYLYAKSGSLGNNYCLSGYLVTKSGKTLIFSFMNNHFKTPGSEVKNRMRRILEAVRDAY